MHTHSYKKPVGFEGKRVVVVGFANSAMDAAVELSTVADQVNYRPKFCELRSFIILDLQLLKIRFTWPLEEPDG